MVDLDLNPYSSIYPVTNKYLFSKLDFLYSHSLFYEDSLYEDTVGQC